jgi:hypothetical protein
MWQLFSFWRRSVARVVVVACVALAAAIPIVVAAPPAAADECSGSAGSTTLDITLFPGKGCLSDPGNGDPQFSYLATWASANDGAVWSTPSYCTASNFDMWRTYKWVGGSMGTHTYTWTINGLFTYEAYYIGAYIDTCNATATVSYYVKDEIAGWELVATINQDQTSGLRWFTGGLFGGKFHPTYDGSPITMPNTGQLQIRAVSSGPAVTALGASDLLITQTSGA